MATNIDRQFTRAIRTVQLALQPEQLVQGVVGDGAGNISTGGSSNIVWVRVHGDSSKVVQAYLPSNLTVVNDQTVELSKHFEPSARFGYEIVGLSASGPRNSLAAGAGARTSLGLHSTTHERRPDFVGGNDPVDVYERAIVALRASPHITADMGVYVEPGAFMLGGYSYYNGGDSPNFVADGNSLDVLVIDGTLALSIVTGAHVFAGSSYILPAIPAGKIPLLGVNLRVGMTYIVETDCIDLRPLVSGGTIHAHRYETPSGTVNGVNATFSLLGTPNPVNSLMLFRNGLLLQAGGNDYTFSGATITFQTGAIPYTGDVLYATYIL